ncbi:MAG: hypothetical protein ABWK05_05780 [Pyrobaculum sp.]
MAVARLEALLPRLSKLPPRKKAELLYKLRGELDEDSFRHFATLLAVDLSRAENPRRWAVAELEEEVEDSAEFVEEFFEDLPEPEVLEEDQYVGQRVVERLWKSSI